MGKTRPELQSPPEVFYDDKEARKYTENSHIKEVQNTCSIRCFELLDLDPEKPSMILDLGCGSGLSGAIITEEGHYWVGMDISKSMLEVALESDESPNLMLGDMGQVLPFRAGMFDGCISVSALQWLCHSFTKEHNPVHRLAALFTSLFSCLSRGSRAIFQFYPQNEAQETLLVTEATKAGFTGGVVTDYPNSSKAKKKYLTLMCGGAFSLPRGLDDDRTNQAVYTRRDTHRNRKKKIGLKDLTTLERIARTKEKKKRQGKNMAPDSKYSGKRRAGKFW